MTILKILTSAPVSTWSSVSSGYEHVPQLMLPWGVQCLLEPINRWEEPCALLFNSLSPYKEKEKRESAAVHSWARESKWPKRRHSLLCCLVQTRESHLALWMLSVKVEGFPRFEIDFWWLIHGVRGMLFACKSPSHHAIGQCCWFTTLVPIEVERRAH